MVGAFGKATATELARPGFVALVESFGVPAHLMDHTNIREAFEEAFASECPNTVVQTSLKMFAPTHLKGSDAIRDLLDVSAFLVQSRFRTSKALTLRRY